jgi:hypothetical protein
MIDPLVFAPLISGGLKRRTFKAGVSGWAVNDRFINPQKPVWHESHSYQRSARLPLAMALLLGGQQLH